LVAPSDKCRVCFAGGGHRSLRRVAVIDRFHASAPFDHVLSSLKPFSRPRVLVFVFRFGLGCGQGGSQSKQKLRCIHTLVAGLPSEEDSVETVECADDLTGYHDAGVVEHDLFGHDGPSLANVQVIGSRRDERLTVQVVCKQIMASQCIGANGGRSCSRRG
jgi:hypothetical protein